MAPRYNLPHIFQTKKLSAAVWSLIINAKFFTAHISLNLISILTTNLSFLLFFIFCCRALKLKEDPATLDSLGALFLRQSKLTAARHVYEYIWRVHYHLPADTETETEKQGQNSVSESATTTKNFGKDQRQKSATALEFSSSTTTTTTSSTLEVKTTANNIHIHYVSCALLLLFPHFCAHKKSNIKPL